MRSAEAPYQEDRDLVRGDRLPGILLAAHPTPGRYVDPCGDIGRGDADQLTDRDVVQVLGQLDDRRGAAQAPAVEPEPGLLGAHTPASPRRRRTTSGRLEERRVGQECVRTW